MLPQKPKSALDHAYELRRRILNDPTRRLQIIKDFYSEMILAGDRDGADIVLLILQIVMEQPKEDPTTKAARINARAVILAAVIAFLGGLIAVTFAYFRKSDGGDHKYLTGVVTDRATTKPLRSAEVQVLAPEANFFSKGVTDQDGKYSAGLPLSGVDYVTVKLTVDGYRSYERRVPPLSPNDISLEPLPQRLGIPDGHSLQSDLQIIERTFAVTILFSPNCTPKAKANKVHGVELEADRNRLEELIKALLDRVQSNEPRYKVNVLELGRRYEVNCY